MPASSKEFHDIQATIGCGFTLKLVRDMTKTYSHIGYGIAFDAHWKFSFLTGESGKNVTIFEAAKSLSVHTVNRKKYNLVLGKGPTDGLDDTKITGG